MRTHNVSVLLTIIAVFCTFVGRPLRRPQAPVDTLVVRRPVSTTIRNPVTAAAAAAAAAGRKWIEQS